MAASDSPAAAKSDRCARARSTNRATAASLSSGGTGCPRSPATRRSSRLVTSVRRPGAARTSRATISAAAGSSCSRLSRTRSTVRSRRWARKASPAVRSGVSRTPRATAMAGSRRAGSRSAARSTNQTPCGNRSRASPATARASRVLPLPPGPTKVTMRAARRSSRTRSISSFLPTRVVTSPGRFVGTSVVRRGRGSSAAPGTTSRYSGMGSSKSLTALGPSSTSSTSASPARRVSPRRQRCHESVRQDDLPAVPRRGDPGGVVDVDPDVVLRLAGGAPGPQAPLAEMEAHPDPDGRAVRPRLGRDGPLCGDGGRDGVERRVEGREERVPLGLDHDPALTLDRRPEDLVVPPDQRRPTPPNPRRARAGWTLRCR